MIRRDEEQLVEQVGREIREQGEARSPAVTLASRRGACRDRGRK